MDQLPERRLIALVCDGQWEIDEYGRIWRTKVRSGLKAGGWHLVPCERRRVEKRTPQGYMMVRAMIDGERIHAMAHRLVWQYVVGDIEPGLDINHKNGLKDDNRPSNLETVTPSEQSRHAHRTGLVDQHGQSNPAAKLTNNEISQIRQAYALGGWTMAQLAERFGVRFQHISKIVRGARRAKQGGPTTDTDLRHSVCERDPQSGRYVGKAAAGRLLDGRTHDAMPEADHG